MSKIRKIGGAGSSLSGALAAMGGTSLEKLQAVKREASRDYRVKLLNLADYAQAVWHIRDDKYLELKLYGFDSKNEAVQFVAPFAFESEEKRNEVFADDVKLTDFANAVFVTQMANIDPELNTDKFKKLE